MCEVRWSHSSILHSDRPSVTRPASTSSSMRGTSLACTRRRITSGRPGVRFLRAEAETSYGREFDVATLLADGFGERVIHTLGAIAAAARPHPYSDARPRRQQFPHPRFPYRIEGSEVLDARHFFFSFARCST